MAAAPDQDLDFFCTSGLFDDSEILTLFDETSPFPEHVEPEPDEEIRRRKHEEKRAWREQKRLRGRVGCYVELAHVEFSTKDENSDPSRPGSRVRSLAPPPRL